MSLGTILGTVGTVVGAYFGGPIGAQIGAIAGSMIGNAIDPPKGTRTEGQKLTDQTNQTASYATFVGTVYGRYMRAGNVFWVGKKQQKEQVTESGGGKGSTPTNQTVTYYGVQSFAIGLSDRPILGIKKMKINGDTVYSTDTFASAGSKITSSEFSGYFTIYTGEDEQPTDPTMQAEDGIDNVPDYEGHAYCMFTDLNLEKYGNALPQLIQFEVVSKGAGTAKQGTEITNVYVVTGGYITSQIGTSLGSVGEYFRNRYFMNNSMIRDVSKNLVVNNLPVVIDTIDLKNTCAGTQSYVDGIRYYGPQSTRKNLEDISMNFDYDIAKIYQYQNRLLDLDYELTPPNFSFSDDPGYRVYASLGRLSTSNYALYVNSRMIQEPFSTESGYLTDNHANSVLSVSYMNIANPAETQFNAIDSLLPTGKYFKGAVISQDQTYGYIFYSDSDYTTLSVVTCAKFVLHNDSISIIETSVFEEQLEFCGIGKANVKYLTGVPTTTRFDFCACDNKYLWLIGSKNVASIFENYGGVWQRKGTINISQLSSYDLNFYAKNGLLYLNDNVGCSIYSASEQIEANKIFLSSVVADQLRMSGLEDEDFDLTEIQDIEIDGYLIGSKASARSNIELLCNAYFFDLVSTDGQLQARRRGRAPVVTITSDDFIIENESSGDARSDFNAKYIQELSLPKEVQVVYMNLDSDYAIGAQYARDEDTSAINTLTLNMPLLLSNDKARQIAETIYQNMWLEREVITFSTSFDYVQYEPADVINVIDYNNIHYTVRLVSKTEGDNGRITWEAVRDERSVYSQEMPGATPDKQGPSEVKFIETTEIIPMNLPLMLDGQVDQNAYYVAASAKNNGQWNGAVTYRSLDNVNFSMINDATFTGSQNTIYGICENALLDDDCFTYDIRSKITVNLRNKNAILSSRPYNDLQSLKFNYALIGSEVVQFANANLIDDGVYELSGFIRGMHGTDVFSTGHDDGEKFILLDASKIKTVAQDLSGINNNFWVKGVSVGQTFNKGDNKAFTNNGLTITPLSPYSFVQKQLNGDFKFLWYRRARKNAGLNNNIDVPLDENTEAYTIEFYSDNTYSNAVSQYQVTLKQSFTYTTAMQIADFGTAQSVVYSKIYQLSDRIGRGFASIPKVQ